MDLTLIPLNPKPSRGFYSGKRVRYINTPLISSLETLFLTFISSSFPESVMKCLCWLQIKGSCPESNEVLDTKVRSKSAALAPSVRYTVVLSGLYLAPQSWSVALRLNQSTV